MAAWAAGVGFFVALSHLTRADGVLLLGVFAVALTHQVRRSGRGSGLPQYPVTQPASTRGSDAISPFPLFPSSPLAHRRWVARWRQPFLLVVIAVAAYVLAMSPWFARNWALVGAPLPPAGLKTLFLREYNEFYGYGVDPGLRYYLDWGLLNILRSKAEGLGRSLLVLFGMEYYLVPLAALGIWRLRRDRRHWPFAIYGLGLYLTMSLAFTFPAARGSMLHSGAALVPWLAGMALVGLDRAVDLAARRLRHWNVPVARRNFAVILVAFSVAVSLFLLWQKGSTWDERYQKYEGLASWFAAEDPGAVVMVVDPPGYYFSSQRPAVVIPSDGPAAALDVARRYGARYLALEAVHARPFQGLYRGEVEVPGMERVRTMGDTQIYRLAW